MWKIKGGPYLLLALLLRTNSANCQLFFPCLAKCQLEHSGQK